MCSDTWGPHSGDGIADKRNSDTETADTHLGLAGHCVAVAVSQGLLVLVRFKLVSQVAPALVQPAATRGGALHVDSPGPIQGPSLDLRPWPESQTKGCRAATLYPL